MRQVLSVWIPGRPKTKGSLDFQPGQKCRCCSKCEAYLPGGRAVENVVGSKRWRQMMAYLVEQDQRGVTQAWPLDGPVMVVGAFHLPAVDVSTGRVGDIDKLARNLLDALQDAQVFSDDVQVTRLLCEKVPAGERGPGLDLRVLVPD